MRGEAEVSVEGERVRSLRSEREPLVAPDGAHRHPRQNRPQEELTSEAVVEGALSSVQGLGIRVFEEGRRLERPDGRESVDGGREQGVELKNDQDLGLSRARGARKRRRGD